MMTDSFAPNLIQRRGLMLVVASPSGAGKMPVFRRLQELEPDLSLSVSVTTRAPRPAELSSKNYQFVDQTEFDLMVNRDQFLEYAKVFGNSYGTPRLQVEKSLSEGKDVLFDIDWQGTKKLAEKAREDLVSVFVLPASWQVIEHRLYSRAESAPVEINRRMTRLTEEMSHWDEYDYVIVNRDLDETVAAVRAILLGERLRRHRQTGLVDFIAGLQSGT